MLTPMLSSSISAVTSLFSGMVFIKSDKTIAPLRFAGNASDSDGGEQRPDLLGIGYGSDGVGSEGKDVKREEVRAPAHRSHRPCDAAATPCCSAVIVVVA